MKKYLGMLLITMIAASTVFAGSPEKDRKENFGINKMETVNVVAFEKVFNYDTIALTDVFISDIAFNHVNVVTEKAKELYVEPSKILHYDPGQCNKTFYNTLNNSPYIIKIETKPVANIPLTIKNHRRVYMQNVTVNKFRIQLAPKSVLKLHPDPGRKMLLSNKL